MKLNSCSATGRPQEKSTARTSAEKNVAVFNGRFDDKRIYRLYCEHGLALRRRKHRHSARRTVKRAEYPANLLNQRWAMDFVSDTLSTGRSFRVLTIVDECTRESPAIEADTSLPGMRVIGVLERLAGGSEVA